LAARKLAQLRRAWRAFRELPAGQRFQIHHEQEQRKNRSKPAYRRVLQLALVPLLIAIGVVLMFIPGPAILFFFLAAASLASHSLWVARALDRAELGARRLWTKFRRWRKARQQRD
jgi:hypothetical protein